MAGSGSRLPDEVGDLALHTTRVGQRTVLAAEGEIDLVTARRLAVICPVGPIRRAFALTGLDAALPLYVSREEAHRQG